MTKGFDPAAVLTMSASQSSFAYHATEEIARPSQKRRIASTSAIAAIGATWKATRLCDGSPPKDAMPLAAKPPTCIPPLHMVDPELLKRNYGLRAKTADRRGGNSRRGEDHGDLKM